MIHFTLTLLELKLYKISLISAAFIIVDDVELKLFHYNVIVEDSFSESILCLIYYTSCINKKEDKMFLLIHT